jgi:peptidoglycan/xylan/chitin deacetylase (PgdA/CDA1 family)
VIRIVKRSFLSLAGQLHVSSLVGDTAWRRRRLLILGYHSISLGDEHRWNGELCLSPATFERRLDMLHRHGCAVLPLGEAIARLYRHDLPPRAVALTFDDGYYDFLVHAHPRLSAHRYPATVYLTTRRSERNLPITNPLIAYLVWKRRVSALNGRALPGLAAVDYPLETEAQRGLVVSRLQAGLKRAGLSVPAKDDVAREVAGRLGVDYDALLGARILTLMNPEEVSRLARAGVDFQLHTHSHRAPSDPGVFLADVVVNRDKIEAMTGARPEHLCYPSGVYRPSYLPALQAHGIVSATTCAPSLASAASHPLLLPRFVDSEMVSDAEFEGWLTGLAWWLPRREHRAAS